MTTMIIERLSRWVISIRRKSDVHMRVFCFPHAGGGASLFRVWAPSVPDGIELCAVPLPGREERMTEQPFRNLTALVQAAVPELRPFLDRPFAMFGHSMGALVAFAITRELCSSRRPPVHLFVSGERAPHLRSRRPPRHTLPPGVFEATLALLDGTPSEILRDAEMMAVLEPLLRADFALVETYVHEPGDMLDVPITAFGGVDDSEVNLGELEAWQSQSRQFGGVRLFPGNHFYLRDNPAPVVEAISAAVIAARWLKPLG